jgi:hypothetical protein
MSLHKTTQCLQKCIIIVYICEHCFSYFILCFQIYYSADLLFLNSINQSFIE